MRFVMHKVLRNTFVLINYVNSIGAHWGGVQAGGQLITGTLHICVTAFQVASTRENCHTKGFVGYNVCQGHEPFPKILTQQSRT